MFRTSIPLLLIAFCGVPAVAAALTVHLAGGNALASLGTVLIVTVIIGPLCLLLRASAKDMRETLMSARRRLNRIVSLPEHAEQEPAPKSLDELAGQLYTAAGRVEQAVAGLLAKQRDLEQSRTLLETVLGAMAEGVLVLDGDRRVLFANAVCRSLFNFTEREMIGRPLMEVCRATELQQVLEQVLAAGLRQKHEVVLKRHKTVLEVTAAQLPLAPRPGAVVVLHNVTELRRLEQMRREFVSNVSHELKTPLTAIQAYADTLMEGGLEDTSNNRAFVERIIEQSNRLGELIHDMLRLARIESQLEAFNLRPVRVREVVLASLSSREALAAARKISLTLRGGGETVAVLADAGGLRTIVDNLISNAITYTRPGGAVEVRWDVEDSRVAIEVEDNGIGIPTEHQQRIFERFYRVERARSRGGGGTGLGLSIVKHLSSVFGGTVEVESEVGRGSVFRVWLPLAIPEQSPQAAPTVA